MTQREITKAKLHPLGDVAGILGISIYGVRRLVAKGEIKSVNIGARVLISTDELDRIVHEGIGQRRTRHKLTDEDRAFVAAMNTIETTCVKEQIEKLKKQECHCRKCTASREEQKQPGGQI